MGECKASDPVESSLVYGKKDKLVIDLEDEIVVYRLSRLTLVDAVVDLVEHICRWLRRGGGRRFVVFYSAVDELTGDRSPPANPVRRRGETSGVGLVKDIVHGTTTGFRES